MKLIILKVILILGAASTILAAPQDSQGHSTSSNETDSQPSEDDPFPRQTLEFWFDFLNMKLASATEESGISKYTRNVDQNCVQQKLKMSVNGNKKVTFAQAVVSIAIGYLKCYGKTENTAIIEATNEIMGLYDDIDVDKFGECYLNEIKQLEPTAKLVENFDASQMKLTAEECGKHLGDKYFEDSMSELKFYVPDLSAFTCGNFKTDDLKIFFSKLIILVHEKKEDVKESELEKLRENIATKLFRIFDCVLENL